MGNDQENWKYVNLENRNWENVRKIGSMEIGNGKILGVCGYPVYSGTRPQLRIPVAASDIEINRVCDFREILRMIDKVKKF